MVDEAERGKEYRTALLKGMLKAARKGGATVMMDFGPPNPHDCSLAELLVYNGFGVCGMNDHWFADQKNATAVFLWPRFMKGRNNGKEEKYISALRSGFPRI